MKKKTVKKNATINYSLGNVKSKDYLYNLIPQSITSYQSEMSKIISRSFLLKIGAAILISLGLISIQYFLFPPFQTPYLFSVFAITLSALYGGLSGGLLSTVITALLINFLFFAPEYSFKFNHIIFLQNVIYFGQGILVSFLIAKEKQERKEIHAQAEQFYVTLSSIGDGVIVVDDSEQIAFINKAAEDLTGWKNMEAVNQKIENVFNIINERTMKKVLCPTRTALKKNRAVDLANHTLLVKKNGSTINIDDSAAPIRNPQGIVLGAVLIFRDITQKKYLEQKKDDFVSIASHELKTPVTSIKLFVELLQKKLNANKQSEYIKIVDNVDGQLNKLTELVNDLLDLSRIQSGKLSYRKQLTDIDKLLKETINELQQVYTNNPIILTGKIRDKVFLDRERIKQVLVNLISNAVKYSNEKDKILLNAERYYGQAMVKVSDFGLGIPKDQQSKVFERFHQVDNKRSKTYPGLGLGLYISSQIIKGHHGKIWVESEPGKGSTFQFSIPINQKKLS